MTHTPVGYMLGRWRRRCVKVVMGGTGHALALAGSMTWGILWAAILRFAFAAMDEAPEIFVDQPGTKRSRGE